MPTVKALDHINIQTDALAQTARFFADVLELSPREPFAGAGTDRLIWMFDAQDRPLVHLTLPGPTFADDAERPARADAGRDTGAFHHAAFECEGHAAMLDRLERLGIASRCRDIEAIGLRQIFVHEPNGVLLELNFRGR
jgi:catechol 2,3-dioxygenase-like lactoylglutathione lyase family enzyme